MKPIMVIKANGHEEAFDRSKLDASLARTGAPHTVVKQIVDDVVSSLQDGMTTAEIYKRAFRDLKKLRRSSAARYSMRKAIADLGPSGFPFEQLISQILLRKGYTTETNVIVRGGCIEHEVDVVAYNDKELIFIEAKFHNNYRIKTDSKDILYVKARFDDLRAHNEYEFGGQKRKMTDGWLVTNTKFTRSASDFAECNLMHLIGWDYPPIGENLHTMIDATNLNPMTCLTTLTSGQKKHLINENVVLVETLQKDPSKLDSLGLSESKKAEILEEARQVLETGHEHK